MSATFLDRNKKKSLLAALLLLLRQRKMLVLLVFLVMAASAVFLGPSSWVTGFPGGRFFAADVAWIAAKMGYDVSKWGIGAADKRSYDDLLAAFRAARTGGAVPGWSAFFGRNGSGGAGSTPSSLDYVKGSKSDLGRQKSAGGSQSVAAVVDPADPKNRAAGNGVTISEADLGGQREGLVKQAFAGGFLTGLFGGGGGPGAGGGDAALSGGAYATKGFFSGNGGAAGTSNGLAQGGVAGAGSVPTPSGMKGGGAKGTMSANSTRALVVREQKGVLSAGSIGGNVAYTQLAEGASRDQLGTTYCKAPDCPGEYAATNTGAIYDGNAIGAGFLTSSDPGGNSAGLINSTVNVPPDSIVNGNGQDPAEISKCVTIAQQCAQASQNLAVGFGPIQDQINADAQRAGKDCNPWCICDGCNSDNNDLAAQCNNMNNLQDQIQNAPCNMPADCTLLGITSPPHSQMPASSCLHIKCSPKLPFCG